MSYHGKKISSLDKNSKQTHTTNEAPNRFMGLRIATAGTKTEIGRVSSCTKEKCYEGGDSKAQASNGGGPLGLIIKKKSRGGEIYPGI